MMLRPKSLSLRHKILAVLAILPIFAIGVIVTMAINVFKEDKLSYVYESLLSATQNKSSNIQSQLSGHLQSLKAITANYDPNKRQISTNGKNFFKSEINLKAFMEYQWDGSKFKNTFRLAPNLKFNEQEKDVVQTLLSESWHKGLVIGVSDQYPMHFYVLNPADKENGRFSLLLIENTNFFALFSKTNEDDSFLFHPNRGYLAGKKDNSPPSEVIMSAIQKSNFHQGVQKVLIQDQEYFLSFSKVGLNDLVAISITPKEKALAVVQSIIRRSLLFSGVILCILIAMGAFAASGLTQALQRLSEASLRIKEGDFSVRVKAKSGDEVGQLSESFNQMAEEIVSLMEKTAESARMENELKTAHTVQDTLFPDPKFCYGPLAVFGNSVPASECGGDWWHYTVKDDKLYLWIGDATGHGVPAALLTSAARAVTSVIEALDDFSPARALEILNKAIHATSRGEMMMTFFIACFDFESGKMTYANASHDPPYLLNNAKNQKPKRKSFFPLMESRGRRLGEKEDSQYKNCKVQFSPGDRLILYTDGVFDVNNGKGDLFGERRFLQNLVANHKSHSEKLVGEVFEELESYRNNSPLDDDVTLVIIDYVGGQSEAA